MKKLVGLVLIAAVFCFVFSCASRDGHSDNGH